MGENDWTRLANGHLCLTVREGKHFATGTISLATEDDVPSLQMDWRVYIDPAWTDNPHALFPITIGCELQGRIGSNDIMQLRQDGRVLLHERLVYALKHVQAMYEGANLAGLKVDAGEWP